MECKCCRALMEQMSVSGLQRQTLDSLQEKLNDLETTLTRERDEHQRAIVSINQAWSSWVLFRDITRLHLSAILVGWHPYQVCCATNFIGARAWASQVQALSSGLQSCPWHCTWLSQRALPIKRWRCCSFLSPLGGTRRSLGSTFEYQLSWLRICSRHTVMEQTTSNNPVIWQFSEFQEPIESSFLVMDHFFHSSRVQVPLNWTPCYGAFRRRVKFTGRLIFNFQNCSSEWKLPPQVKCGCAYADVERVQCVCWCES